MPRNLKPVGKTGTARFYLREYLFPYGCAVCGGALPGQAEAIYGICKNCLSIFHIFDASARCVICGKPLVSEKNTCLSCRGNDPQGTGKYNERILKLRVLFPYLGKFRSVLASYKFEKSVAVANFFAEKIIDCIEELALDTSGEIALVPVPPRPGKIKKQGWDQIEYLARLLEKRKSRINVRRCLKRLPSKSQKELNRDERSRNLKGKIVCVKKAPVTAILFDDVITTGSTLDACASVLLEAGTVNVYGICLFYD